MRRVLLAAVAVLMLGMPLALRAQTADEAKNAQQARVALDAMVQALGGQAWLDLKSQMRQGHVAAFFQGKPSGGTTKYWEFHVWPDKDRIEYTEHRDVLQFYIGRQGWEVTYRGKKELPQEQVDDYMRRRDHSIETAVKVWLKDPKTILIYEGQRLAERHLAEQVTLISAENEAVTILMDKQTHLPLRRSFEWRDPLYKDKNLDAEEYDDYHPVDGFPTPFTTARFKNGDMISQRYLDHATYNQELGADFWSVDAADRRIKK
jgi:Ni/Co efflux regulator RcnB